ncbi:RNA polymerase sigma factor [Streptomyces sp. NPDC014891]|uniref:RNA polymerase sigma factor n=1 Tax=Streptomyces sp. NPDC014891 TaxID=3364929 RepID=UPI0037024D9E
MQGVCGRAWSSCRPERGWNWGGGDTSSEGGLSARNDDFAREWQAVRPQVLAYARARMRHQADAEDLCQMVAVRAWRGYATFRRDASFPTWVMAIAVRESARLAVRQQRLRQREVPLGAEESEIPAEAPEPAGPPLQGRLLELAERAWKDGGLNPTEYAVVRARLSLPDHNWDRVGAQLGLPGASCAVTHSRAVGKLRVALFVHHPELLGGPDQLARAARRARAAPEDPLTTAEYEVFRSVVLERRADRRPRNWLTVLRAACRKVAGQLSVDAL